MNDQDDESVKSITEDEYKSIKSIVDNRKPGSRTIREAYGEITRKNPELKRFKDWKKMKKCYNKRRDFMESLDSDLFTRSVQEMIEFQQNPNHYLLHHIVPFSISRNHLPWSPNEDELLIQITNKLGVEPKWGMMAMSFPGRTGQAVHDHYKALLSEGRASAIINQSEKPPFGDITHRIFLPVYEEILTSIIAAYFEEGTQMDDQFLIDEARELFYTPYVLAERITYELFSRNGRQIYKEENKYSYTDEFKEECRERTIMYEESTEKMVNELEEIEFNEPVFSSHWIKDFMSRNSLSFRKAHFKRRGDIKNEEVELFIAQFKQAIAKYTFDHIFNVDETSVRLNNSSDMTIAPTGSDEIIIPTSKNIKENFTAIATCSINHKYDLIVLGVGKTERCCTKFGSNAIAWPSSAGWVNEQVMIDYLLWFSKNVSLSQPCALLLDQYPSHCTDKVKGLAALLNIELIYIPKNATGKFQPLDRRIFGILKAKLCFLSKNKVYSGNDRFEKICDMLISSWTSISNHALQAAWSLPELN